MVDSAFIDGSVCFLCFKPHRLYIGIKTLLDNGLETIFLFNFLHLNFFLQKYNF